MATVLSVTERFGLDGNLDLASTSLGNPLREYTRIFDVTVDSPVCAAITIFGAPGIPSLYEAYSVGGVFDLDALCVSVKPTQNKEHPEHWEVVCRYTTKVIEPLRRAAKFSYQTEKVTLPFEYDVDGNAVMNSAYEKFDPPIEIDRHNGVIRAVKNWPTIDIAVLDRYIDCVNSKPFLGFAAFEIKFDDYTIDQTDEGGIQYWQTTYVFKRRRIMTLAADGIDIPKPWNFRPFDQGFSKLDENFQPVPIWRRGAPITAPAPLDGAGDLLAPGATPYFHNFQGFLERDLNELGILDGGVI